MKNIEKNIKKISNLRVLRTPFSLFLSNNIKSILIIPISNQQSEISIYSYKDKKVIKKCLLSNIILETQVADLFHS
jgi:hypothetical protein|tara:strand:+ start:1747 stop:1974 length:228 start_codon:yes stop_codon:yes gene_type:complete